LINSKVAKILTYSNKLLSKFKKYKIGNQSINFNTLTRNANAAAVAALNANNEKYRIRRKTDSAVIVKKYGQTSQIQPITPLKSSPLKKLQSPEFNSIQTQTDPSSASPLPSPNKKNSRSIKGKANTIINDNINDKNDKEKLKEKSKNRLDNSSLNKPIHPIVQSILSSCKPKSKTVGVTARSGHNRKPSIVDKNIQNNKDAKTLNDKLLKIKEKSDNTNSTIDDTQKFIENMKRKLKETTLKPGRKNTKEEELNNNKEKEKEQDQKDKIKEIENEKIDKGKPNDINIEKNKEIKEKSKNSNNDNNNNNDNNDNNGNNDNNDNNENNDNNNNIKSTLTSSNSKSSTETFKEFTKSDDNADKELNKNISFDLTPEISDIKSTNEKLEEKKYKLSEQKLVIEEGKDDKIKNSSLQLKTNENDTKEQEQKLNDDLKLLNNDNEEKMSTNNDLSNKIEDEHSLNDKPLLKENDIFKENLVEAIKTTEKVKTKENISENNNNDTNEIINDIENDKTKPLSLSLKTESPSLLSNQASDIDRLKSSSSLAEKDQSTNNISKSLSSSPSLSINITPEVLQDQTQSLISKSNSSPYKSEPSSPGKESPEEQSKKYKKQNEELKKALFDLFDQYDNLNQTINDLKNDNTLLLENQFAQNELIKEYEYEIQILMLKNQQQDIYPFPGINDQEYQEYYGEVKKKKKKKKKKIVPYLFI